MNNIDIKIVEVGPRDGLQNEKLVISTGVKLELIDRLRKSGLQYIEASSFVSPKWVPQMADHLEIAAALSNKPGHFGFLVPNEQGFEKAVNAGVKEIAVFAAASETFSKKNINCTIQESLDRFRPIIEKGKRLNFFVRGYISCVAGCPYEGPIHPKQVLPVAKSLHEFGCDEISLGDTIGVGTPNTVLALLRTIIPIVPLERLAVHFHNTYGQAIANIYASLDAGIRIIDSSVSGLGGCPYAKGASGNVPTEDVLYLLHGLGYRTGIDLELLLDAGRWICNILGILPRSQVGLAKWSRA
ncbi:MAG: hydroxymethylglutaryl-CoA lyase [Gammaproteobacteria bacterium]